MRVWVIACLVASAWTLAQAPAVSSSPPVTPIASLDVSRYLVPRYEVAKFPNRFRHPSAGGISSALDLPTASGGKGVDKLVTAAATL